MVFLSAVITTVLTAALRFRGVRGFSAFYLQQGSSSIKSLNYVANGRYPHFTPISLRSMSLSSSTGHLSFMDFLEHGYANASEGLKQSSDKSFQLTIGNEAGDADSIVSALSLAYVNNLCENTRNRINIPLISVPRADIPLRRDAVLLLDIAGVHTDELIYSDDELVNKLLADTADSSITLVDHNRIRSSLSHLSHKVSAILDHHEDEQSHELVTIESGNRIIAFEDGVATVASTCTLVAEKMFRIIEPSASIDRSLGLLLLGVILLDSVNMLPEAGKGTARDKEAIQTLLNRTDWKSITKRPPALVDDAALDKIFPNGRDAQPDKTALFDALSGAKFDPKFWKAMSAKDCLRIDYKRFPVADSTVRSIGISTVLMDMKSFLEKQNFQEAMSDFVESESIDILGVMSMHCNDEGTWMRELLMTGIDAKLVDSFAEHLLNHPDAAFLEISEERNCINGCEKVRLFSQGNIKGSRKQMAPVLFSFASTLL
jgi:exopolyphosphatase